MYFLVYFESVQGWRWTLFAANHRKIANSGEGYVNKVDCYAAINLVKASFSAPTKELSRA